MQFQSNENFIQLGSKYRDMSFKTQSADEETRKMYAKSGALVKKVLTPFSLDQEINNREKKSTARGGGGETDKYRDNIAENVRQLLKTETIFEDEAVGMMQSMLTSEEISQMDYETKKQMLLGVDLERFDEE